MINNSDLFTIKPKTTKEIGINDILKDFSENCGNYKQVLKGGLALSYYYNSTLPSARNTIDIDFHISDFENWNKLKEEGIKNATSNSKLGCIYTLGSEKINPNGSSLTILYEINDRKGKFKIDMNYGTYCKTRKVHSIEIYSPEMIIADKLSVICSSKIRRRTKDLYDVYLVICNENFDFKTLTHEIKLKLESRDISLDLLSILNTSYLKELEYSYYKMKLIDFPDFSDIIDKLLYFIPPVMDGVILGYDYDSNWDHKKASWSNELFGGTFVMKSLTGTVCKETASGILELSTFPPFPVLLYNEHIDLITSHFRFIKTDCAYEYTNKLSDNLFITTKEKTIIDMLEDGEHRVLMESLHNYLEENQSYKLFEMAKKYNKEELLKLRLIDLDEYKNDLIF